MTKEGFNWKSIFINENQEENKNSGGEINTELKTTFPQELHTNQRLEEVGNPYLSEIQKVYEKGFESLNGSPEIFGE